MRRLFLIVAIISSMFLISCGGGGGGSSTSKGTSVTLKLNFENSERILNLSKRGSKLTIGNTVINSVLLQYGKHGATLSSLDVTNAAVNGTEVVLSEMVIGADYDFYLAAYAEGVASDSVLACQAEDSNVTIEDGANVSLDCTISNATDMGILAEVVFARVLEASISDYNSDDINVLVQEIVSNYISKDAGDGGSFPEQGNDGSDRESFIYNLVYWMEDNFSLSNLNGISVSSVTIVEPLSRGAIGSKIDATDGETYAADVLMVFSNNVKVRLPMNFVYEDGHWKMNGNGRPFHSGMNVESALVTDNQGKAEIYTGVRLDVNGESDQLGSFGTFYAVNDDDEMIETVKTQDLELSGSRLIKKEAPLATGYARTDDFFFPIESLMINEVTSIPSESRFMVEMYSYDGNDNRIEMGNIILKTTASLKSAANTPNTDFPHVYLASGSGTDINSTITINIKKPTTGSQIAYYNVEAYGIYDSGGYAQETRKSAIISPDSDSVTLNLYYFLEYSGALDGYVAISAVDENERYFTVYARIDNNKLILTNSATRPTINTYDATKVNGINGFYQYIDSVGDYNFSGLVNGKIFTSSNYNGTVDDYPYLLSYDQDEIEADKVYNAIQSDVGNSYNYSIYKFFGINSDNYTVAMNYGYDGGTGYYKLSVGKLAGATNKYTTEHYNSDQSQYLPMANIEFIDAVVNNNGNTIVAVVRGDKDVFSTGNQATAIYLINTSDLSLQAVYGLEDFNPSAVTAEYDSSDFVLGGSYVDGGNSRATVLLVGSDGTVKSTVLVGAAIDGTGYDLTINNLDASKGSVYASGNLYDTSGSLGRVAVMRFNLDGDTLSYNKYLVYANAKYINTYVYGAEDIAVSRYTGTVTLAFISTDYKVTVNELDFSLKHRSAYTADFCDNSQYRIQVTQAPYSSALVTGPGTLPAQNSSSAYINLDHFGNAIGGYVQKYSTMNPTNNIYTLGVQGSVPTFTLYDMKANAGNWQTSSASLGSSSYQEVNSGNSWFSQPMIYMP